MKTEWKQVKLGDYADFSNGINFGKDYYSEGIKLITVSDFKDRLNPNYDSLVEVDDSVVRESDLLKNNDIVFVRSNGNKELVGRCMIIKNLQTKLTYSGFCIRARFNDMENVSPNYFVYYFKSPLFRKSIANSSVGANIQNLNQEILASHKVLLPPLPTQQKIANILSRYDEAIENNNKRIKLLEQMAQNLYKEWFVRFRFPGWQNAEFENGIPKGWEVEKLNSILDVKYGKDHSKIEEGKVPILGSGGVMRFGNKVLYSKESVLIPRKGSLNNVMYMNEPFWTVDTMFFTEMKRKNVAKYIYYVLSGLDLSSFNSGAALPSMTTDILYHFKIILPSDNLLLKFDDFVTKCFTQMDVLKTANQNLAKQRNLLLPRLMSGKLEVE